MTVLAEFVDRVEQRLDTFTSARPAVVAAMVRAEDVVRDLDGTMDAVQTGLGLRRVPLTPRPLDPSRAEEWRTLLSVEEQERVRAAR